ncbi:MAG: RNA polymerase subunit sigma [Proteobacteria bacterium]|nr:MAG: RNA polymerase subunit sigma [Pseudomonadota bacterium]
MFNSVLKRLVIEDLEMKYAKLSDNVLVENLRKGCLESFEEIIKRYESKAFNLAMRFLRNQEDAEEVLQDVFSTVYTKIDGFRGQSAFSSWLYRITVNAAFMKLRKRKQHSTVALEDLTPAVRQICMERENLLPARSDSLTYSKELRDILEAAINRLPRQYRAVFVLRDVDGLSNQEVSEILSLSIPAVKSRLHRSRLMLRKKLMRYYQEFTGNAAPPLEERSAA